MPHSLDHCGSWAHTLCISSYLPSGSLTQRCRVSIRSNPFHFFGSEHLTSTSPTSSLRDLLAGLLHPSNTKSVIMPHSISPRQLGPLTGHPSDEHSLWNCRKPCPSHLQLIAEARICYYPVGQVLLQ